MSRSLCRLHGGQHTPAQKAAAAALLRNCFSLSLDLALFWRAARESQVSIGVYYRTCWKASWAEKEMMIVCAYLATFAGERAKVEAGSWLAAHFTQLVHLHQNKSKRRASLIKINHFGQKIKHTHIYSSSVLYSMVVAPQTRPAARSFFISLFLSPFLSSAIHYGKKELYGRSTFPFIFICVLSSLSFV